MMKFISLVLVATSAAFGLTDSSVLGNYTGQGTWKAENVSGKYTGTMALSLVADASGEANNVLVQESLTIETPEGQSVAETYQWTVNKKGNGFFDITTDDKVTGSGYCFEFRCHTQGGSPTKASGNYEETLVFSKKGIWRMGSEVSDEGAVAWEGWFEKK